jgi:DNA-binding GntR family transcriptional regulator
MVVRRPGRGTFVAERDGQYLRQFGSVEDLMALSVDTQMEVLVPLHRGVDIEAASRLRLSGDVVHSLTFRRLHNGVPFCLTTVHLPGSVAERLATLGELGEAGCVSSATVIGLLDARLEHPIAGADQSITVTAASPSTAEHLGCQSGTPLLRVDRIYFDTTERLVELGISHFLPEHYSYRVRLRRSVS